jgi:predicted transcriptional regulator
MNTKELVLEAVKDLPDDAPVEDAMERLLLLAKIERGIEQADAGNTISHEQLKQRLAKWLK